MKANKTQILLYGSFIIYCVWVIISALCHEPNADEYHVWGMVYDMNLYELWQAMSTEGHFIFWHILQWPFVKWFGMDYHSLYCVSVPAMILGAWLLLFKLNFSLLGKLLIVFSAPFCYYFPVIARCYVLIPPLLIGIAVLYQKKKYPWLYCILLGLLANTHVYIEGVVAVLWCLFVYNQVVLLWKTQPVQARRNLSYSLITILFVIFAFSQVVGSILLMRSGWAPVGQGTDTTEEWFGYINHAYFFQMTSILHRHCHVLPNLDVIVIISAWIFIIIGLYEVIKASLVPRWQIVTILVIGIGWQVFFACNIYGILGHRIWLIYFVVVMVLWLTYLSKNNRWIISVLIPLWILTSSSRSVVIRDLFEPLNNDINVVVKYDSIMSPNVPCYTNFFYGPHDLLQHKCFYSPFEPSDSISTRNAVEKFTKQTSNCYLLLTEQLLTSDNEWHIDTLWIPETNWEYYLYYVEKNYDEISK